MDTFLLAAAFAVAFTADGSIASSHIRPLAKLMSSLTSSINTELAIISDFAIREQREFAASLAESKVPSSIFEVPSLSARGKGFENEPCPLVGPTNNTAAKLWYRLPKDKIVKRWVGYKFP